MPRQAAAEAGVTSGQDWSHIDNAEKAEAAVAAGQLISIMLLAEEFGGEPHPVNMVPVPPGFDEVKRMIDGTILPDSSML